MLNDSGERTRTVASTEPVLQCIRNGMARTRAQRLRRNTAGVGRRKCRAPGASIEWFHEIRSDEDGMFVTYRKESHQGGEFGRPWREDGDRD